MDINNYRKINFVYKVIFILALLTSTALLIFEASSLNKKVIPILHTPLTQHQQSEAPRAGTVTNRTSEDASVSCDIKQSDLKGFVMCGIKFMMPDDTSPQQYLTFRDTDRLSFNIRASSTAASYDQKVTLVIKSIFKQGAKRNASNEYDNSEVKFHAARIIANGPETIPLRDFKVETWWEDLYKVPHKLALKDFSKVVEAEVHIREVPITKAGLYSINISKLEVHSTYLQKADIYAFLALFWLALSFLYLISLAIVRNQQLKYITKQTYYDPYTKLSNLYGFQRDYCEYRSKPATLYLIKLTNWKTVVHHFGEQASQLLVESIVKKVKNKQELKPCSLARVANDELVIIKPEERLNSQQEMALLQELQESHSIDSSTNLRLNIKLAIVCEQQLPEKYEELLSKAYRTIDSILNTNKSTQLYNQQIDSLVQQEIFICEQIELALKQNAFYLLYMPVYDIDQRRLAGAEALIRCTLPSMHGITPDIYIPIAEKTGLIKQIDAWVIDKAIATLATNQSKLSNNFVLSINISSRELLDTLFINYLKNVLSKYGVDAKQICIEITETFFVDMDSISYQAIDDLKALGCHVSLDDFGTGYTSFAQLMNIPIDELKIDRSFINQVHLDSHLSIVKSMIAIASSKGYKIVAEGVEERAQLESVKTHGCTLCQGYLISKPIPFEQVVDFKSPDL